MNLLLRTTLPVLLLAGAAFAEYPGLTLPPSGNNQKATVIQYIGPVKVSIDYSSPAVHGPDGKDRRGQIWGKLVPYGTTDLGFTNGRQSPWRAGANENTVFAVSNNVMIEGQPLPAGRYGFHILPGQEEWTLIFNKNPKAWGAYFYDETLDALRVKVKPHKHEYREWLTYEFTTRRPTEATAELQWEELAIPWTVKVPDVDDIYISRLKQDLTTMDGFQYQAYVAAAQYTLESGKHLEQGLEWANIAAGHKFIGDANFDTLSTKARLLSKLGREAESREAMKAALKSPATNAFQIHQYGRQLLADKKPAEALEVFKLNAERNGEAWPTNVGLARGYAATGDNAKALEYAKKAAAQAPDDANRKNLEEMVKTLSAGQPISQ